MLWRIRGQVSVQKEKETVKNRSCVPLSVFLQTDFIHMVVKTAGVTLKSHPSGSVDRGSSLTRAFIRQKNPRDLGTMLWRQPYHGFPKCAASRLKLLACLQFRWELVPPGRASHSTPKELWLLYSLFCCVLMPPGKGANSAVSEGNSSWEIVPRAHLG